MMQSMRSSARPLAFTAAGISLAAVLGLVESWTVPALPVPGVRLGLANLAVVVSLALLGPRRALAVSLGKVLLVGLLAGTLLGPASLMALAGSVSSWCAMAALAGAGDRFTVVGWSAAGAFAHVLAQLLVACLLTGSSAPLVFAPLSLGLSLALGSAVGVAGRALLARQPLAAASCRV